MRNEVMGVDNGRLTDRFCTASARRVDGLFFLPLPFLVGGMIEDL
jgi:hypothetical protein